MRTSRRGLTRRHELGFEDDAFLGLERVYAELGWTDSLLAPLDTLIHLHPADPIYRSAQLSGHTAPGRAGPVPWTRLINTASPQARIRSVSARAIPSFGLTIFQHHYPQAKKTLRGLLDLIPDSIYAHALLGLIAAP